MPVLRAIGRFPRRPARAAGGNGRRDDGCDARRGSRRFVGRGVGRLARHRPPAKERSAMINLHRELAPVSAAAWASIEDEARRTFTLHLAGRRVAEVSGPGDEALAAVGTGHLSDIASPAPGVLSWVRIAQPVVELRVPFALSRPSIDDVDRGAQDPDWQPVKDAARIMAVAEDRAVFEGYQAAGITGIRAAASNPALALPADARQYPDAISEALSALRLAGVGGPYALALSAEA